MASLIGAILDCQPFELSLLIYTIENVGQGSSGLFIKLYTSNIFSVITIYIWIYTFLNVLHQIYSLLQRDDD